MKAGVIPVVIDPSYAWRHERRGNADVWHVGDWETASNVIAALVDGSGNLRTQALDGALSSTGIPFAVIVETPTHVFAGVDAIRSYPVFYSGEGVSFRVANSARLLRAEAGLDEVDPLSRAEFNAAGYVTGSETLYRGLFQLKAGEWLLYDRDGGTIDKGRHYEFYPTRAIDETDDALIARVAELTDLIFERAVRRVNGAPVVVPLSGGLDSRLVVCKLKEHGCSDLSAFTFGSPGNDEMKIAREVAKKLGVKWRFVPSRCRAAKRLFDSPLRRKYWEYADFLSSVPAMADFQALQELREEGHLPANAVIINGQSGDFITGGHVPRPERFQKGDAESFFAEIRSKHYSLWDGLPGPADVESLKRKIAETARFNSDAPGDFQEIAARYELWEWQERQCKYVVNGQRKYDFMGLKWELPLWEKEYLEFWRDIPAERKSGQRLFKAYLDRYDFFGLFRNLKREIWRWPGASMAVPVLAQPVKWVFGRKAADLFYKYCAFVGYYRFYYYPYGLGHYLKSAARARNPVSFHVERWLAENPA